jgi:hypothetical protein
MVGLAGDRSGVEGGPGDEPALFLLTTHEQLKTKGIGRGATGTALRQAFPKAREWFVLGHTHVFRLGRGVIAGVKESRVRLLAVYDTSKVRTVGAVRDWLRRSA